MITAADVTASLSHGESLGLLLTVEGFMFAAISLAVTLSAPNPKRQQRHPRLDPERLLMGASLSLCAVAVGAVTAWASLFVGGDWQGLAHAVEGVALLAGVVVQPVIAVLLTLAARRA